MSTIVRIDKHHQLVKELKKLQKKYRYRLKVGEELDEEGPKYIYFEGRLKIKNKS